jgi:phage-related minor tail protein
MSAEDPNRPASGVAPAASSHPRPRLGAVARRALARAVPAYARYRARNAMVEAAIGRLETELGHAVERHAEQIERLEDLVGELVLSVESLRSRIAAQESSGDR